MRAVVADPYRGGEALLGRESASPRLDLMLERDPATLPDIRLSGRNDRIAYRVAHALVPLFGAIELRIDERRTLIDGNEPVEVLLRRRQDEMLEHIEAVQAAFEPIARMFERQALPDTPARSAVRDRQRSPVSVKPPPTNGAARLTSSPVR